ncbi:serine/threonine-protein kinase [Dokdonella koreensis]|uniref:Serine/threonine protein kinase with TPR repeats n=1 Tax=Dokdonella koreensis DS-123 TaxID=1300342 RepID=A0A161HIL8_9GAMM|nr:serine/threonine-protein kinase [Dokdonella koreensis]ANB16240.1 Serine/threonine protein kinase with TPR repeats [Dokdonella koreensis DS-123]
MSTGAPLDGFLRFEPGAALRSSLAQRLLLDERLALLPGQRVGAFRVLREIGRGGLGAVYLAERSDVDFSQRVALKVVGSRSDRSRGEILLARERQALARLQHPCIARLVSGGRSGELLWFAMEYVEGQRIDAYCEARAAGCRERIRLLLQVCAAIGHAHSQLVIHRDLKPSNVLVTAQGEVRLLDFGIAGLLDAECGDDPAATASTPGYASPEQRNGQPAGIASDIHQLGQLLARLTAGLPVAARRHADLSAIVAKALAPRPEDRYPSVDALAADLRALLDLRPVSARRAGAGTRLRLLTLRHPWSVGACLLLASLLAASHAWYLGRVDQARRQAEREARTAQQIARFMVDVFRGAGPDQPRTGPPDVETLVAAGAARAMNDLAGAPELQEPLLSALASVYLLTLDNPTAALPLFERAAALAAEHGSTLPDGERHARIQLHAVALRNLGRIADARTVIEQALPALGEGIENARPRADLIGVLASLAFHDRRIADSIALFEQAIGQARRLGPDEPTIHFLQLNLAVPMRQAGRMAEALAIAREALGSARRLSGPDHSSAIHAQRLLADLLTDAGDAAGIDEAGVLLADAHARLIRLDGPRSTRALSAEMALARLDARRGAPASARRRLMAVLETFDALPAGTHIERALLLRLLGDLDLAGGDATAALARYRAMEQAMTGNEVVDFGDFGVRTACALLALGQTAQAQTARDQAKARADSAGPAAPVQGDLQELSRRCAPAAVRAGLATFAS